MLWYKGVIRILFLNLVGLDTAFTQTSVNHFINPPPAAQKGNLSNSLTWFVGDVHNLSWETTSSGYSVFLLQDIFGDPLLGPPIYSLRPGSDQSGPFTTQYPWEVNIANFSLADSNAFWLGLTANITDPNAIQFQSHYFIIENQPPFSATSLTAAATSLKSASLTVISTTTTVPTLTGPQNTFSTPSRVTLSSIVSSTSTSTTSSEPSASATHRREKLGLGIGLGVGGTFALALIGLAFLMLSEKRRRAVDRTSQRPHQLDPENAILDPDPIEKTPELPVGSSHHFVSELFGSHDPAELPSKQERHASMLNSEGVPAELSTKHEPPFLDRSIPDIGEVSELSA